MRKLAWAALGFAAAAALAEYILPTEGLPYIAAALGVLSAGLLFWRKPAGRRAVICGFAAALGLLAWWAHYTVHIAPAEALAGQDVTVTARLTDYPERYDAYERAEVRILEGAPKERALLYLYPDGEGETLPDLRPGDVVETEIRITSAVTRRGERSRTYTAQGQDLLGYIRGEVTVTGRDAYAWRYWPQELCHAVKEMCGRIFPADAAPFVKALLTGDSADLEADVENYTAMRTAGVLHIVAISGMHLGILVAMLEILLGKSRRTGLLCVPVILFFMLMTGCKPSMVRASVMMLMLIAAPLVGRERDGITSLAAALLLLLIANPMAIGGVGLQLSFTCMLGLVYLLPRLMGWASDHLPMERDIVRFVVGTAASSLSATAFSLPLSALYFGAAPLLGPLANVLTILPVEVCFGAGYVLCALGAVWPAAAMAGGRLLAWPVRFCELVYRLIARVPAASIGISNIWAALWLALTYALFILWWFRLRRRRVSITVPVSLSVMGLCAVLLAARFAIRPGQGRVTALDVDQGLCVVLADHDGAVMVDCGSTGLLDAGGEAASYLFSIGKTRLDLLVLTHLHADHANGAEELIYRMPVGRIILPAGDSDEEGCLDGILTAAQKRGTEVVQLAEESVVQVGDMALALYLPNAAKDMNERGIVVRAEMLGKRAYVMGDAGDDAELALLAAGSVTDMDVLIAGHHGSRTASGVLFLEQARPETAVVSVGYNIYGQPSAETMERLARYCDTVLRTDEAGDVTIRFSEEAGRDGEKE